MTRTRAAAVAAFAVCLTLVLVFRGDIAATACAVWEFATCTYVRRAVSAFVAVTFTFIILPIIATPSDY